MDVFLIILGITLTVFIIVVLGVEATRQDSKLKKTNLPVSPYDHLLNHLEEENGRLLKEVNTIKAIRRLETTNERLRNEIETNTPEYDERLSESVYERLAVSNLEEPIEDFIDEAKNSGAIIASDEELWKVLVANDFSGKVVNNLELTVELSRLQGHTDEEIELAIDELVSDTDAITKDLRKQIERLRKENDTHDETLHRQTDKSVEYQ